MTHDILWIIPRVTGEGLTGGGGQLGCKGGSRRRVVLPFRRQWLLLVERQFFLALDILGTGLRVRPNLLHAGNKH